MVLIVNGQDAEFSVTGETLDEIRQEVGLWAFQQGHALWEMRYNGDIVQPDDVALPAADGVVEVVTRSFAEVLGELRTEVAVFLPRLTEALSLAADRIYEGRENDGVQLFQECLDGLDWTFHAMRLARTMTVGLQGETGDSAEAPSERLLATAESVLRDIERALADGDVTMLADLLQSSLCPVMNEWLEEVA